MPDKKDPPAHAFEGLQYDLGVFEAAVHLLGSAEEARTWMTEPNCALGGASPLDYADTEPGALEVKRLIHRLEHGVFS